MKTMKKIKEWITLTREEQNILLILEKYKCALNKFRIRMYYYEQIIGKKAIGKPRFWEPNLRQIAIKKNIPLPSNRKITDRLLSLADRGIIKRREEFGHIYYFLKEQAK